MPDKKAREQLVSLEKLRLALATTQAQADELHSRVEELLERSIADDAELDARRGRPPRAPAAKEIVREARH